MIIIYSTCNYWRVTFVCWLLFGIRSTPVLKQWHVKDPGHYAKSASGRLCLSTHTLLTQRCWSELTMPLYIVWESIRKRAHTQLVREHSATVAGWATVDWSWPKEWHARADLHLKSYLVSWCFEPSQPEDYIGADHLKNYNNNNNNNKIAGGEWMIEHFPQILASEKKATDY